MIEPIDLRTLDGKLPIAEQHVLGKRSLYKAIPPAWQASTPQQDEDPAVQFSRTLEAIERQQDRDELEERKEVRRLAAARADNGGTLPGLEGFCQRCGDPCGEDGQVLAGLPQCKRCQKGTR